MLWLTEEEKTAHLRWCRDFLDHHCILRSPPGNNLLVSGGGGLNAWQFYLPIAVLNQEFGRRIGLLFWNLFFDEFTARPFQLCGCESGGSALITVLQSVASEIGIDINVFSVKKEAKKYGLRNWFEGIILENVPVMLVDDVLASGTTLSTQAKRVYDEEMELYPRAFCITSCKPKSPTNIEVNETKIEIVKFYRFDDFAVNWGQYTAKYGKKPVFRGIIV